MHPYDNHYQYKLDFFNESVLFVLIYHMITFSDEYSKSIIGRDWCGYSLIAWTIFLFGANVFLIVFSIVKAVINGYRLKWL
jgi:hypothetical protein